VDQSSLGSFIPKGQNGILIVAIGTKEHPSRVCTTSFSVGVRQYFGSTSRPSFSIANVSQEMMEKLVAQLTESLTPQLSHNIKEKVTKELRAEFEQRYNPVEPVDVIHARDRASSKGSCDVEDLEDDDTKSSYQCRLFVEGNPSRVVAIEKVYPGSSTMHIVPM